MKHDFSLVFGGPGMLMFNWIALTMGYLSMIGCLLIIILVFFGAVHDWRKRRRRLKTMREHVLDLVRDDGYILLDDHPAKSTPRDSDWLFQDRDH